MMRVVCYDPGRPESRTETVHTWPEDSQPSLAEAWDFAHRMAAADSCGDHVYYASEVEPAHSTATA
jgi:hypothetical protein